MKTILCCAAFLGAALAPAPLWAANARNPYSNVNHANDAGNNTGDSQVDALNQAQLSQPGRRAALATPMSAPYAYTAPAYVYAYPPPVYYSVPVYVRPWRPYYYGW